jgi:hypothetical protein
MRDRDNAFSLADEVDKAAVIQSLAAMEKGEERNAAAQPGKGEMLQKGHRAALNPFFVRAMTSHATFFAPIKSTRLLPVFANLPAFSACLRFALRPAHLGTPPAYSVF